jgi:lipopolysaccharide export system protein LptC
MAIEANIVPGSQRYRIRTGEERARAFTKAERHSRIVAILRKVLPVVALLVLASYFISTQLSVNVGDLTASIDGIEMADGNLRMTNPKLKGADKKNGQYVIGADYADQDIKSPNVIKLHAIKADIAAPDGGWSRMEAIRGVYDSKIERLVMQDRITVATSSGVTGELIHASLDTKNQILRSHRPVSFVLTNGTVKANALTLRSAAHTLTFRGKVRVHIVKPPKETAPAQKENVPAAQVMPPMPGESGTLPAAQVMPPMPGESGTLPVAQGVPPMPGESGALPDDASALTAGPP